MFDISIRLFFNLNSYQALFQFEFLSGFFSIWILIRLCFNLNSYQALFQFEFLSGFVSIWILIISNYKAAFLNRHLNGARAAVSFLCKNGHPTFL